MARPKRTDPPVSINLSLPESVIKRMQEHLFSEAEGRIPVGAQSRLITGLLYEHFREKGERRSRTIPTVIMGDLVLKQAMELDKPKKPICRDNGALTVGGVQVSLEPPAADESSKAVEE